MAIVGVGENHTSARVELLRAHGCPVPILADILAAAFESAPRASPRSAQGGVRRLSQGGGATTTKGGCDDYQRGGATTIKGGCDDYPGGVRRITAPVPGPSAAKSILTVLLDFD